MRVTDEQVEERIALYTALRDAREEYSEFEAALPDNCPEGLVVRWADSGHEAARRVTAIVRRSWAALRAAALRDAKVTLGAAEEAVKKFEAGDET